MVHCNGIVASQSDSPLLTSVGIQLLDSHRKINFSNLKLDGVHYNYDVLISMADNA